MRTRSIELSPATRRMDSLCCHAEFGPYLYPKKSQSPSSFPATPNCMCACLNLCMCVRAKPCSLSYLKLLLDILSQGRKNKNKRSE